MDLDPYSMSLLHEDAYRHIPCHGRESSKFGVSLMSLDLLIPLGGPAGEIERHLEVQIRWILNKLTAHKAHHPSEMVTPDEVPPARSCTRLRSTTIPG